MVMFAALCSLAELRANADEILVSAAASLTDALSEIGQAYTRVNPRTTVRFNFAASGALQRQIEQGAPVDVFVSASPKEMDALQKAGRIDLPTRSDVCGNRLVLIVSKGSRLRRWEDLLSPSVKRIALADPDSVPAGRYAKETLTRRGLWDQLKSRFVFGENVRQTLTYVATGDADAGVVFETDARLQPSKVRVVQAAIPGRDHIPILYPAAALKGAPNGTQAKRFVQFLKGSVAQRIFAKFGFSSVGR